jgi:hypothetical protein
MLMASPQARGMLSLTRVACCDKHQDRACKDFAPEFAPIFCPAGHSILLQGKAWQPMYVEAAQGFSYHVAPAPSPMAYRIHFLQQCC